jgi:5-methylcytosine-specific restriction endonuclease McrA
VLHSNYKYGDTREDGYVWVGKRYNRKRPDGTYPDDFRGPEAFKRKKIEDRKNKKKTYDLISRLTGEEKMKYGCTHCGYNKDSVALDFHHVDRADKFINVSSYWRTSMVQFKKIREEWKKCIVLCANCHRIEEKRIRNEN